jgi:hypothetical protein
MLLAIACSCCLIIWELFRIFASDYFPEFENKVEKRSYFKRESIRPILINKTLTQDSQCHVPLT